MKKLKISKPVELASVGATIGLLMVGSGFAHAQKGYVKLLSETPEQVHHKVKVEKDAKDLADAIKHQNKVDYAINPKKGTKKVPVYTKATDVQQPVNLNDDDSANQPAKPKQPSKLTNKKTVKKASTAKAGKTTKQTNAKQVNKDKLKVTTSKTDESADTVGNVSTAKLGMDLVNVSANNKDALANVNLNALKATREMTYHGKVYIYLVYTDGKAFGWVPKDAFSTTNYQQELKRRVAKQIAEENRKHKEAIRIVSRKEVSRYVQVKTDAKLYDYPSGEHFIKSPIKYARIIAKVTLHNKSTWYMTSDHKYLSAKDVTDVTGAYVEYTADGGFKTYKDTDVASDNAKRLTGATDGTTTTANTTSTSSDTTSTDDTDDTTVQNNGTEGSPTTEQIDLDKVAKQASVSVDKIKELNVGIDSNKLIPNGYVIHFPKSTYDANNYTTDTDTAEFINYLAGFAPIIKAHHLFPSVVIGQAILESQAGQSGLSVDDNNLFGIKGSYLGSATNYGTKEYTGGKYVSVQSNFRSYPSFRESVLDYLNFFEANGNYANVFNASSYEEAIESVKEAGYATDPNYVSSVTSQIEKYNLSDLDK